MRNINAEVIDKLIGVSEIVVRSSEVKPLAKIGHRCQNCNAIRVTNEGLVLKRAPRCGNCSEKELEMEPNSVFNDFQMVRLRELPEDK